MRRYALPSALSIAVGFAVVSGDCIPLNTTPTEPQLSAMYVLVSVNGQPLSKAAANLNAIGPHYFETMGIPLVIGRDIGEHDILM